LIVLYALVAAFAYVIAMAMIARFAIGASKFDSTL
jgi:hypothetical protein